VLSFDLRCQSEPIDEYLSEPQFYAKDLEVYLPLFTARLKSAKLECKDMSRKFYDETGCFHLGVKRVSVMLNDALGELSGL
jgi:hypothetical protein